MQPERNERDCRAIVWNAHVDDEYHEPLL
jgi:hypothetical protein